MVTGNPGGSGALTAERIQMFWNTHSTTGHERALFMAGGHFSIRLEWHLKASERALPILCQPNTEKALRFGDDHIYGWTKWAQQHHSHTWEKCNTGVHYSIFPFFNGWPVESTKCSVPKGLSGLRLAMAQHRKGRVEGYPHRPLENNYMLRDCRAASNLMERRTNWILIGPTCSTPPAWRASSTWTHQRDISPRKPAETTYNAHVALVSLQNIQYSWTHQPAKSEQEQD